MVVPVWCMMCDVYWVICDEWCGWEGVRESREQHTMRTWIQPKWVISPPERERIYMSISCVQYSLYFKTYNSSSKMGSFQRTYCLTGSKWSHRVYRKAVVLSEYPIRWISRCWRALPTSFLLSSQSVQIGERRNFLESSVVVRLSTSYSFLFAHRTIWDTAKWCYIGKEGFREVEGWMLVLWLCAMLVLL